MAYEIDQSWKIERTNKDSYFAIANGKILCVRLKRQYKRKMLSELESIYGRSQKNILEIFAAVIAFLINTVCEFEDESIFIDVEYPGYNGQVKLLILNYLKRLDYGRSVDVNFKYIGKKSHAHIAAINSFQGKRVSINIDEKLLSSLLLFKKDRES